ncbi:MAG TPA: amino acid ABC transporter permease [Gammaproteobacteria bacterium]|jgi:general L-amino acid transport system permease protein|nr:amino acid ABC transporter permease [Acidiferrobacteraceae bacterium]MDP6398804.1 ABC transporter permease subunit [Arenicellales bacterium]MDP6551194.1 ABC transporter permease subunit [Arenicellales bacterium]MDP6918994.1 ABC transporter permease subunit [Arenicellales bacterium]HCX88342.1 amino acid ABC transporter permease [Gammaproteobacteria bacterium]|tara:strand:+ start:216 stop:1409 length:1194 start_codon:yes stop_codon:yes gene_type:complete
MIQPAPSTSNPLLRLWRNQESRGVIIQILTMVVLFAFMAAIARNVVINLEAVGKEFSFGFLLWPAAYDIGFSPFLEYTNQSTHLRAAVVGLLNTLLVAFWGCILATMLGFILGIMRLSSNWLVSKISYVYVEFLRNVPILIHILAIYSIVVTLLPPAKKAINVGADAFFLSNRGFYVPSPVFEDGATFVGIVILISITLVFFFKRWAHRTQDETGKIYPVLWISIAILIALPGIAFLATGAPLSWDIPVLKGFNFKGGMAIKPEFLALWLGLSMYTACFIAEIVRAGIVAVSHGQSEAAFALGLRPNRTLQLIIIPQALRVIVPPLCSQYLNLTKNSSLAIAIGYMDITATLGGISLMQTGKEMETMLIVMGVYLLISLLISAFMNWFNHRIKLTER